MLGRLKSRIKALMAPSNTDPRAPGATYESSNRSDWYAPALLGARTIGERAVHPDSLRAVIPIVETLEGDDYIRYLLEYYRAGLARFGDRWRYADITTALWAAADLAQPRRYLEIGVRRGRSLAVVASRCPTCAIVGFDLWLPGYAGLPNPGADFVRAELRKVGHQGDLDLISGNSRTTVPHYFRDHPQLFFDLITVDGDHSRRGATSDLRAVLPRLAVGGVLVFDDIAHPQHRYLRQVWEREVQRNMRFATWAYTDLGFGVTLAVRRE